VLLLLILSATPSAQTYLEAGLKLYEQGAFEQAVEQLEEGLKRERLPELLYALGQAERRLGHCQKAVEYYGAFVLRARSKVQVKAAQLQIDRCRAEPVSPEAPVKAPEPEPAAEPAATENALPPEAPVAAPPAVTEVAPSPAWYRDGWGAAAGAVGLAAGITGTVLAMLAQQTIAAGTQSYDQYLLAREAVPRRTLGLALAGAGGALIVVALIRYIWLAHSEP